MSAAVRRGTSRRSVLRGTIAVGAVTSLAAGCAPSTGEPPNPTGAEPSVPSASTTVEASPPSSGSGNRTLLVYFSRPGENYFDGGRIDLEVGNTEVLATAIGELVQCDVHRLRAVDTYSDDYDDTVARNVREQDADARPAILEPLESLDQYDTVLIGSPIWNVRPPMLMATFAEAHDFTGKTVHPFVTYAVSGLGRAERDYTTWCAGAVIGEGLAVRGEEVNEHADEVAAWLQRAGLLRG